MTTTTTVDRLAPIRAGIHAHLEADLAHLDAHPPARWRIIRRRRWETLITRGRTQLAEVRP